MKTVRESWTDERLDDLKESVSDFGHRMDAGFAEGRTELRHEAALIRREMREGFQAVDARFDSVDARFDSVDARFDSVDSRFDSVDSRFDSVNERFDSMQGSIDALQRTIIQIGGGMAAAFCAALIGLIATQL
jgi:tetrahydromethanopterin S-methyltransferase subunit G